MNSFEALVKVIEKTRKECPWDKEQTVESLKKYMKEELEEVMKAIDSNNDKNLKEELGDLLWNVLLMIEVAKDEKKFNLSEILDELKEKIIRRHPHVFSNKKASTPEQALEHFYNAKKQETILRDRKQG